MPLVDNSRAAAVEHHLHGVDAEIDHVLSEALGFFALWAEFETLARGVALERRGDEARARNETGLDLVAQRDFDGRAGCAAGIRAGEAVVEQRLGVVRGDE